MNDADFVEEGRAGGRVPPLPEGLPLCVCVHMPCFLGASTAPAAAHGPRRRPGVGGQAWSGCVHRSPPVALRR